MPMRVFRSERLEQAFDEAAPGFDRRDQAIFVERMRAVTIDAKAVERRDAECGGEIAVGAAADHRDFGEHEVERAGFRPRRLEELGDAVAALIGGPVDPAAALEPDIGATTEEPRCGK